MVRRAILSVDTGYDSSLRWFESERSRMYDEMRGGFDIMQLPFARANRHNMLRLLEQGDKNGNPYHAVTVSSHGSPGEVRDDGDSENGILFSVSDSNDVLGLVARNRFIYLCCCEAAGGGLTERLLDLGATGIAGFVGSPSWNCSEGKIIWRDLDLEFVRCIVFGEDIDSYMMVQKRYLSRIENLLNYAGDTYKSDLENMRAVLKTMVIQSGDQLHE